MSAATAMIDPHEEKVTPREIVRMTGLGIATIRRKYLGGIIPYEKRGMFVFISLEVVKKLFGVENLSLKL